MTFAFSLLDGTAYGLAQRGLVIGLGLCFAACSPSSGTVGGAAGEPGTSVGGAGGSGGTNQGGKGGTGGTGGMFTLPDAATVTDVAPVCVKTADGSCCGNSTLDQGEQCDDGNAVGGDGCSAQCTPETNYVCLVPGEACISTVHCGDGKIGGSEQCDDGNTTALDGCDSTCQLEPGWSCPVRNAACVASACGDRIVAGSEQCDDGNTASGDGCSPTCQLEAGFACGSDQWHPAAKSTECYATVCGDGHKEGTEQCDDSNTRPFDGCSPTCTNEPKCGYPKDDSTQPYQCFSVCGDGIKMPDEVCDDGNIQDGDGCSATCTIEPGYTCTAAEPTLGDSLSVPILYRDFTWHHPQFEVDPVYPHRQAGIASKAIGVNGKPVYDPAFVGTNAGTSLERPFTMDGPPMSTTGTLMTDASETTFRSKSASNTPASLTTPEQIADNYAQWYTDDPKASGKPEVDAANPDVNRITIQSTLALNQISAGTYQYYSSEFFPLDGLGFGNITSTSTRVTVDHNYAFTSEAHYWFQYNGGEKLDFRGDDDVWVFVNGQLSVDLGGIHTELRGIVTLNGATTQVCVDDSSPACAGQPVCDTPPPPNCTTVESGFGLVAGNIYEISVFQAERHVTASNYKLTLSGFNAPKSLCKGGCGDGIVTRGEACDLGTTKNTGEYGTCNSDCTLSPRCGDGMVQTPPEECDDGVNLSTYGMSEGCAPGCRKPPSCGDGNVDASFGEQCDQGTKNGQEGEGCDKNCQIILILP